MRIVIAGAVMLVILLATLFIVPVIQQRRLSRIRATFAGRLLNAQEDERAAVARELHDDMVQRLVTIGGSMRDLQQPQLDALVNKLDALADALRDISHRMHPSAVTQVGLAVALEDLAESYLTVRGLQVNWVNAFPADHLSPSARVALYRVAQESLSNATRYSGVHEATLSLTVRGDLLELNIRDEGKGFVVSKAESDAGLGLISMRERMSALHGSLRVFSAPGEGTTITAVIPIKRNSE